MKKTLLAIILLIIITAAYLAGSRGPDPTQWFLPPTPTPTCTMTSTATATNTVTPTVTPTFTLTFSPTPTDTPVPKKKASKKARHKKILPTPTPTITPTPTLAPPEPPALKPICNSPALPNVVEKGESNNTFATAQDLGALTSPGLQVKGSLSKVFHAPDTASADAYKVDPGVDTAALDVDVYTFTTSSPFRAVLDCYSHVVGRPNPVYHEENYHLEIYNESFESVGSSNQNNPVEAIEITAPGNKFYAVIYGVDGEDGGKYRLTLTPKESNTASP